MNHFDHEAALAYERHACTQFPLGIVLFLHGLGSCGADWMLQLPPFQDRYNVLTLDLPGHSSSPAMTGRWRIEDMAEQVSMLLANVAAEPVYVVGLSLGGAVALALALAHPEQIRSLVLVNAFARLQIDRAGRGRISRRLFNLMCGDMLALGQIVAGGVFPHPAQCELREIAARRIAQNSRQAYMAVLFALRRFDARAHLEGIQMPTLIISGEADTTVAAAAKQELADHIPGAVFESIPGSGHATPLDEPDRFNELVLSFFDTASAFE
ncbi:MAG: alpha/beta fold hydrolase [Anaerolineales bacterium]|nr:alpha/beta fold hydrolase [Anaerolineales bacterium]